MSEPPSPAPVDFGRAAADYATHRAGFPAPFFEALAARGLIRPGARAVDIGAGTGTVARGLARRGMAATGLEPSAAMRAEAARLDRAAGVRVVHLEGRAEATGLPAGAFHLYVAGQCWHWFDRPRAAAEARRLLAPGGAAVIAHFDWLPTPGNVVAATEALILAHNPEWAGAGGDGKHPAWLADLASAGFKDIWTESFDLPVSYSHAAWRGRVRASAGVGAVLDADAVAAFDADLAALLRRRFPTEPLAVPHRV